MSWMGADAAVGALFSTSADALAAGGTVSIAGFETFSKKSRPPRQGRNPRAASNRPSFKAGRTLRDAVNKRRPCP